MAEYKSPLNSLMEQLPGMAMQLYQSSIQQKQRNEDREWEAQQSALQRMFQEDLAKEERGWKTTENAKDRELREREISLSEGTAEIDKTLKRQQIAEGERIDKARNIQDEIADIMRSKFSYDNETQLVSNTMKPLDWTEGKNIMEVSPNINKEALDVYLGPREKLVSSVMDELKNRGYDTSKLSGEIEQLISANYAQYAPSSFASLIQDIEKESDTSAQQLYSQLGWHFRPKGTEGYSIKDMLYPMKARTEDYRKAVKQSLLDVLGAYNPSVLNALIQQTYAGQPLTLYGENLYNSPLGGVLQNPEEK